MIPQVFRRMKEVGETSTISLFAGFAGTQTKDPRSRLRLHRADDRPLISVNRVKANDPLKRLAGMDMIRGHLSGVVFFRRH